MAVAVEHQGSRSPALRLCSVLTDFFLLLSTTVSVHVTTRTQLTKLWILALTWVFLVMAVTAFKRSRESLNERG
jgi:hypothetical protein